jgi:hypothetical protein
MKITAYGSILTLLLMASQPLLAFSQDLSAAPREPAKKLGCLNVSRRWQICGDVKRTRFVAGVGIRFSRIDPNGRIVANRFYEDCNKLAADKAIPPAIRAKAAAPCKQRMQLAASEAAPQ